MGGDGSGVVEGGGHDTLPPQEVSGCKSQKRRSKSERLRDSTLSMMTSSPVATITVDQFQSNQRRSDDHCHNVRKLLRRVSPNSQQNGHTPSYLRVTDGRHSVFSVRTPPARLMLALRVGIAFWTSIHASYCIAFVDVPLPLFSWNLLPDTIYFLCTTSLLTTSYVDSGTYEIASLPLVLRKRLWSIGWYADLLSCVPDCEPILQLLKLFLRLRHVFFVRHDCVEVLMQLPEMCRRSTIDGTLRFSFARLLLTIYLFAHLLACLFNFVMFRSGALIRGASDSDGNFFLTYTGALKMSMTMMFSGFVPDSSLTEEEGRRAVTFYVLMMPLVMVFMTTVAAEVIILAQRGYVLESEQFRRLAMVDAANRSLNLPLPLCTKILEYNLWVTRSFNSAAYECLMQNTSKSAQIEVKLHLCAPFISTAPFLQEAPASFVFKLLEHASILTVCASEIIFRTGDPGTGMYFIIRGSADVVNAAGQQLKELTQGTYFGEIALISGSSRLATVVATSFMLMAFFDRVAFQDLIKQHPEMLATLTKHCSQYTGDLLMQQFIDRLGFFQESPHRNTIIQRLACRLVQRNELPGASVFLQGETGDSMFFVLHGTLDIFRGVGKVAEVVDGAHFGELSLLTDGHERTATVTARSACMLAELYRSDFEEVMQDFPDDVVRLLMHVARIQSRNKKSEARYRSLSTALLKDQEKDTSRDSYYSCFSRQSCLSRQASELFDSAAPAGALTRSSTLAEINEEEKQVRQTLQEHRSRSSLQSCFQKTDSMGSRSSNAARFSIPELRRQQSVSEQSAAPLDPLPQREKTVKRPEPLTANERASSGAVGTLNDAMSVANNWEASAKVLARELWCLIAPNLEGIRHEAVQPGMSDIQQTGRPTYGQGPCGEARSSIEALSESLHGRLAPSMAPRSLGPSSR